MITPSYAYPSVLVDTNWVAEHLDDPTVRLVESNEDLLLYDQGHIPGAVMIDWVGDLNDSVRRDYLGRAGFEKLCAEKGISNSTTVVFYGDKNNWWACYAFWVFQLFGHTNARILNGGRKKGIDEGRPLNKDRITSYNVCYTKLLRTSGATGQNPITSTPTTSIAARPPSMLV